MGVMEVQKLGVRAPSPQPSCRWPPPASIALSSTSCRYERTAREIRATFAHLRR